MKRSPTLGRTARLKLRHGDPQAAFLQALPACAVCVGLFPQGAFENDDRFGECHDRVAAARAGGILVDVDEPAWYQAPPQVLGGQAFFRCVACGAVWSLILPERAQRGEWQRIG